MHFGYFVNFHSRDTILFEANVETLEELREMFGSLASGRIKRLVLHRLPFIQAHHGIELRAVCGALDAGVRRDGPGNSFVWELSKAGWSAAAEELAMVAGASQACLRYLDGGQNDVAVAVAKGEYGAAWWAEHG